MKTTTGYATKVIAHIKYFLKKSYRDNISAMAGQSAFFIILSIVPGMMFAFSLFSILTGQKLNYSALLPIQEEIQPYARYVIQFVEKSMQRASSGRAVITAILTLWSAGKGMYCITEGISRIYQLPNKRIWLFKRIYSMGYTIVLMLMLGLCIGLAILNTLFADNVTEYFQLDSSFHFFLYLLTYGALCLVQALLLTLALKWFLHKKVSNQRYVRIRALLPGMLFTVIAWNVVSIGVMIYLRHFAVSSIYGSLASIIVIMLWFYFLMFLLLYGIQFNYIYRRSLADISPIKRLKSRKAKKRADDLLDAPAPSAVTDSSADGKTEAKNEK